MAPPAAIDTDKNRARMSFIIRDAHIHSPLDPFATALHIESGVITWLGDEDTAGYRASAHPAATVVDAGGRLITPAFVDPLSPTGDVATLLGHGVTAVHTPDARHESAVDLTPIRSVGEVGDDDRGDGGQPVPGVLGLGPATSAQISQFLTSPEAAAAVTAGDLLGLTVASTGDAREIVDAVTGSLADLPIGTPNRIHVDAAVDLPGSLLALAEIRAIPIVLTNLAGAARTGGIRIPLAELAQRGIPFALASGGEDPWLTLTAAATTGPAPLTARAAFNAHVRGAWRVTPGQHMGRGVLRVGNPADLAVWAVDSLIVQTPDANIAAWSTDKRAGTPLLPVMGTEEPLPQLWRVFHAGEQVL